MRCPSLKLRITLLFGVLFVAALLALGAYITSAVERHFEEGDLEELYAKLELARGEVAKVGASGDVSGVAQQLDAALVGHHNLSITLVQSDGAVVFASSGADFPEQLVAEPASDISHRDPPGRVWEQGERQYRSVVASAQTGVVGGAPVRVVVSMDIGHHKEFMAGFERSLWLAIAFAILMTVPFGWLAARGALAPLRHMADVARSVSASRLHARIDTAALPVELHGLAADFNGMMVRLEEDFARLQAFSSDIAHELRTPVSNLMTQTQVALSRARTAEAYSDILHSNLEEFDRLARMIADMLFLAQADNGLLPRPAETVALDAEADALAEFYEALAEERNVKIKVSGAATVAGDRLMLRRALSNLLSNALRYALPGSVVAIRIASDGAYAKLAVENAGEAIPPEHLERLFVRFHRVDSSRTRRGDGAGLGLAITRSIVEAHGGHIGVDSRDGMTRFSFVLPVAGALETSAAGAGRTAGPIHLSNFSQAESKE